jgi:TfoX/Sxy family transcriptional regulator of competence genes
MPYDEELADRIREQLAGEDGVSERKMFGGLAFLVNGHMCVAASHTGGLLARVDPAGGDEALAQPHAQPMVMRGRAMEGWISVAPYGVASESGLRSWVDRGLSYVRTLPPK